MLNVTIMNPVKVIFQGDAESVVLPGDAGTFEVMSFHKRILSRLLKGDIEINGKRIPIARGIVRVEKNNVIAVIEE